MLKTGNLAILFILAVAISMAGFARWYRQWAGHRCLEYWGTAAASRIQDSRDVQLIRLRRVDDSNGEDAASAPSRRDEANEADMLEIYSTPYEIVAPVDISAKSGLQHLQRALIEDRTFDWSGDCPQPADVSWDFMLVFADSEGQTRVLVAVDRPYIADADNRDDSCLDATKMGKFLRIFLSQAAGGRPEPGGGQMRDHGQSTR